MFAPRLDAAVRYLVDGGARRLEVHQGLAVRGVVNLGVGGGGQTFVERLILTYIALFHEVHPVSVLLELGLVTDWFLKTTPPPTVFSTSKQVTGDR